MQLASNAHAHIILTHYSSAMLPSYSFILDALMSMDGENHTLEDGNKVVGMEKESTSGQTEAERLHTMLMEIEKEQPSTMIKMDMKKTDFTNMIS